MGSFEPRTKLLLERDGHHAAAYRVDSLPPRAIMISMQSACNQHAISMQSDRVDSLQQRANAA